MLSYHTLRVILGDQLNAAHSWFRKQDAGVLYVIAELHPEATYVTHHIQKLCAFFLAMESFAQNLTKAGHCVCYLTLDDTQQTPLETLIKELCDQHHIGSVELQRPDEYRVFSLYKNLTKRTDLPTIRIVDSEHFLLPFEEIPHYFKAKSTVRMEHFYRRMRHRFNILMDENGNPEGGKWNFDGDNRNKLKAQDLQDIPTPLCFEHDVSHLIDRIHRHQIPYFGRLEEKLTWPVTSQDALNLLAFFCQHLLVNFGRFQDAMTGRSAHSWSLYHSRLSFALNSKLISPKHVLKAAITQYQKSNKISIAQIEGFVRQILGWREYVRGIYWVNMPDYQEQNALQAERSLPSYFWHGETQMHCMASAINQSLDHAYAHHIQRLMVTGNFCLLTGVDPAEVDQWYLGVYIDALEWVELPNTRGMSQFADGGWIASKPYAASGNYIQKMSDYCSDCHYQVKEKTGETACPINSLYWRFMIKHRERIASNPRIGMIYRNWDKQSQAERQAILDRADWCLANIEQL